jgi:hypothetical protein
MTALVVLVVAWAVMAYAVGPMGATVAAVISAAIGAAIGLVSYLREVR